MNFAQSKKPPLMAFTKPTGQIEKWQRAAQLLEAVIHEEIEPRIAINRWPETLDELPDISLDCAHQALWHFESDKEKQQSEMFYMDAQLELLRQIAVCLKQGSPIPAYILHMYCPKSNIRFFYCLPFWQEYCRILKRYWQAMEQAWKTVWQLELPKREP